MPPPRQASSDMIHIIHASGSVTNLMSMLSSTANQRGLVTLTVDLESGIPVTCDVGYLCQFCSRLRPDVCDRQTSDSIIA